nr:S24 family peptidase [Adlercreutzia sp. JBNU-10]
MPSGPRRSRRTASPTRASSPRGTDSSTTSRSASGLRDGRGPGYSTSSTSTRRAWRGRSEHVHEGLQGLREQERGAADPRAPDGRRQDADPGVEGDCMDKVYPEGCLILVDPDQEPRNGSIAAVSIDGANYVMRRLLKTPSTIVLAPESFNPEHEDIVITAASGKTVELAGTVVWYQPAKELA